MIQPFAMWAVASNVKEGENPEYTTATFRAAMPAFTSTVINDTVLSGIIDLAQKTVGKARWGTLWEQGMRLCIAHYATLYLQQPQAGATAAEIMNAGKVQGNMSSKSVGGVSVSYDNSTVIGDLTGWGQWKLTVYGTQFAQLAKLVGKGGMYVP